MLDRLLLGSGKLRPKVRARLEAEGLVLLEEGLRGTIRYRRFRAPGKRFDGKVVALRMAIGLSEQRLVIYGGWWSAELVDSPLDSPRFEAVEFAAEGEDEFSLHVDYDRMDEPSVSGEITIRAKTPNAALIVEQIEARRRR
jgi:hypothetical protein